VKIRSWNAVAAAVLAASTLVCGSARADVFNFSYTFADGGVVSGMAEGIVQADLNTVLLYSIDNLTVLGETIAPAIVGDIVSFSPPGYVTFDGSLMDIVGSDPNVNYGFFVETLFPPTQAGAFAPSGAVDQEFYDATRWSLTAVPEPATWVLMLAGFGALGAFGYRMRGGVPQTAA
jgi:PEP-CTERM motif